MKEKVFCPKCNKILDSSIRFCDKCGTKNINYCKKDVIMKNKEKVKDSISTRKQIVNIFVWLFIGTFIVSVIYFAISKINSNSQKSTFVSSDTTSKITTDEIIFDAKKLVGAKKGDVDKLLKVTGTQDKNEQYVYHYDVDKDVIFDDKGKCLSLCLNTKGKGYSVFYENEILKSYGLDISDCNNRQLNKFSKSCTQIKGFGEVVIYYNHNVNESCNDIGQIVFYTESSSKANDFLEKKSDELDNYTGDANEQQNSSYSSNDSKYSEFLNRLTEIENDDSQRSKKANTTYEITMYSKDINQQYDTLLNNIYNYLQSNMPENEFKKLQDEEIEWVNKKEVAISGTNEKYKGSSMSAYMGGLTSLKYTHDRIYELLDYMNY